MRLSIGCGGAEEIGENVVAAVDDDAGMGGSADAGVGGPHRSNELATWRRLSSGCGCLGVDDHGTRVAASCLGSSCHVRLVPSRVCEKVL